MRREEGKKAVANSVAGWLGARVIKMPPSLWVGDVSKDTELFFGIYVQNLTPFLIYLRKRDHHIRRKKVKKKPTLTNPTPSRVVRTLVLYNPYIKEMVFFIFERSLDFRSSFAHPHKLIFYMYLNVNPCFG